MEIRPAVIGDAAALTSLHLDVWDEAYAGLIPADVLRDRRQHPDERTDRWRSVLSSDEAATWVVHDGSADRLLGFVSAGPGRDASAGRPPGPEVRALYVRAALHGRGWGHALLDAAIGDRAAYLWVLEGNERASRFYLRQRFSYDGASRTGSVGVEHRMARDAGT